MKKCGSKTLYQSDKYAICLCCGYIIKDYKKLKLLLGEIEFKKFERGIKK